MRFDCGPSRKEKKAQAKAAALAEAARVKTWHAVFLLWPRRMSGTHDCRLFETVERRYPDAAVDWIDNILDRDWGVYYGSAEYRPIGGGT